MFIVDDSIIQTYTTPVTIYRPGDAEPIQFNAVFKRLSQEELDELQAGMKSGTVKDIDVINKVLHGWNDVVDNTKNQVEFNPENLAKALSIYPAKPTIVRTFLKTITDAAEKNL